MSEHDRVALLLPADVHATAGLFARDLELESWRTAVRALARSAQGMPALFDLGDRGRTAAETACWLRDQGVERALLGTPRSHTQAAHVLREALRLSGIRTEELVVAGPTADGRLDLYAERDSGATTLALPACGSPLPPAPSPFHPALLDPLGGGLPAWTAYVARYWPTRRAEWERLSIEHCSGVQPRLQMYAGRSLRDRNRELLVNILPPDAFATEDVH
ncbi:MAG: hypothetical protein IPM29_17885 [Planctomycetes bacterium]|nr:hypothetical protein [Planctomycetota bacterium]